MKHEEWEFFYVIEHNYTKALVLDCVIYYVTGSITSYYLLHEFLKKFVLILIK